MRESPTLELLNRLVERGVKVVAYDEELAKVSEEVSPTGNVMDPLQELREHLTDDLDQVVHSSNVIVVHHSLADQTWDKVEYNGGRIIDMSNIGHLRQSEHYEGLYW